MKILFWNIRGLNVRVKKGVIRKFIRGAWIWCVYRKLRSRSLVID